MRTCPICHAAYESHIDFCFKDGAPLEAPEESGTRPALRSGETAPRSRGHATSSDRLSEIARDDLMPPEAISLVDLPVSAVFPDDEPPDPAPQLVRDEPRIPAAAGTSQVRAARYRPQDDPVGDRMASPRPVRAPSPPPPAAPPPAPARAEARPPITRPALTGVAAIPGSP
ncbi:hypothetical protein L6R50_06465, partial [Myxococcota bacterium]|nr:hypothetical protein [Myxococcota bacterium]